MFPEESVVDYRHFAFTTIGSYRVPLVPLSAYQIDAKQCGSGCQTVYHDFQPAIINDFFPGVLRSVDPAWEYCSNLRFADLDHPIALSPTLMDVRAPTLTAIHLSPTLLAPSPSARNLSLLPGAAQPKTFAVETLT